MTFSGTNSPVDVLDYLQLLNSGEIAPNMEPLLNAVKSYAIANHVTAENVIVTAIRWVRPTQRHGRFADSLSGGFFAKSNYIAYEVPYIFDQKDRVLNIGYENDVVHRAAGDWGSFARRWQPRGPDRSGLQAAFLDRQPGASATTMQARFGRLRPSRSITSLVAGAPTSPASRPTACNDHVVAFL